MAAKAELITKLAALRTMDTSTDAFKRALAAAWVDIDGGTDTKMAWFKVERAFNFKIEGDALSFEIERHPDDGTYVQSWCVNLSTAKAFCPEQQGSTEEMSDEAYLELLRELQGSLDDIDPADLSPEVAAQLAAAVGRAEEVGLTEEAELAIRSAIMHPFTNSFWRTP